MAKQTPALRKIEGYHLNVHLDDNPLQDYSLLRPLLLNGGPFRLQSARRLLAFHAKTAGSLISILSYEGDPDAEALLYNMATGEERHTQRRSGEIVATRTHFALQLDARVVAVELNQRGTKKEDLERLLEQLVTRNSTGEGRCDTSLVPIPKPSFLKELDEYDRIQAASVTLVQPNASWLGRDSSLLKYAEASNAQSIEVDAKAKRNQSLARNEGLLRDLKDVLRRGVTTVKEAVVIGNKHGSKLRRESKLSAHALRTVVSLSRMPDGQPDRRGMEHHVLQYCEYLTKNYPVEESP